MALIALRDIRCIDYLAYGTIFTCAMFLPKKKGDVFFPARKAADERWGVVTFIRVFTICQSPNWNEPHIGMGTPQFGILTYPYQPRQNLGRSKLCAKGAKVGMLAELAL